MVRRWTDERLDDLAKLVHHNDGRLDQVANQSADTAASVQRMINAEERRSSHHWSLYPLLVSVLLAEILQLLGAHL